MVQAESAEAIHDSVMGTEVLELLSKLKGAVCKNVSVFVALIVLKTCRESQHRHALDLDSFVIQECFRRVHFSRPKKLAPPPAENTRRIILVQVDVKSMSVFNYSSRAQKITNCFF